MSNMQPTAGIPEVGIRSPFEADPMLKSVDPSDAPRQWTLKGLTPDTINVSRDAAKRSGMKLNAWVSRALEQAAASANDHVDALLRESSLAEGETIQHLKEEVVRLRAQSDDMRKSMETMNTILLKLCADRI